MNSNVLMQEKTISNLANVQQPEILKITYFSWWKTDLNGVDGLMRIVRWNVIRQSSVIPIRL